MAVLRVRDARELHPRLRERVLKVMGGKPGRKRARSSSHEDLFLQQLRLLAPRLPSPEREYRFARKPDPPVLRRRRRWRFDFAWPAGRVAVEVEGAVFARGRHTRGKGFTEDCWKYDTAEALGWSVLRVTAGMLRDEPGRFLQLLSAVIERRQAGMRNAA